MKATLKSNSDNIAKLTVTADAKDLTAIKKHVVEKLAPKVNMPGFRAGKVPTELVEKQLDPNTLQAELLDEAVNHFYGDAVSQHKLRVVSQPKVELTKFVPYTELEFTAEVEVIGDITVPNYKKAVTKPLAAKVTVDEVKEVLSRLQIQAATYKEVTRAAKTGDRATIDFDGVDSEGKAVNGASGKAYPLALGSNTFIPGFEDNVIGMKVGDTKEFTVPFPKNYGVKALQGKKVTFTITVHKIEETITAELDDAFAASIGPFKTMDELKADIKKQLGIERQNQADQEYENLVIKSIVAESKITIPQALMTEQMEAVDKEFRQNLTYRGQTMQEYLENTQQTEEQYKEKELKPAAQERLKAGLLLSEIAELEGITVSPEELEIRMQIMKGQYTDPAMQTELDKPEARRDIASRLMTEKTVAKLITYASK